MEDERRTEPRHKVKVYTDEEIEIFLSGDRREVDRLLLKGLNNLAGAFVPHAEREELIFKAMGSYEMVHDRSTWIDAQMRISEKKEIFWEKAKSSVTNWGLAGIIGWIALVVWQAFLKGPNP